MSELIRAILVMSISGSIIAALLFAMKPFVRYRLPKSTQYYLWLVVLTALLVPISKLVVFAGDSLAPIPVAPVQSVVEQSVFADIQTNPAVTAFINIDLSQTEAWSGSGVKQPRVSESIVTVFTVAYPFGTAISLLYFLISYTVFARLHRRRNKPASAEETEMLFELCGNRSVPLLYRNPLAATPMLFGVFRPVVVLPDREYTGEQLRAVLLHELTHLRRKDVFVKWLTVLSYAGRGAEPKSRSIK